MRSLLSRPPRPLTRLNLPGMVGGVALRAFGSGSAPGWFFVGNALSPMAAVLLGPLVLGKVGLEKYAVLGLATYFSNMLISYADFSTSTHLLAAFSRKAPTRYADLGNAIVLRVVLWLVFVVGLAVFSQMNFRKDALYALVAISLPGALLPGACLEWLFIAKQRCASFFVIRASFAAVQTILTLIWFYSPARSELYLPAIALAAGTVSSSALLAFIGATEMRRAKAILRNATFRGAFNLARRIAPMTAVLLLGPYFVAYALPWYSMIDRVPAAVGAFSVGYRLIVGMQVLAVPLVLYLLSREESGRLRALPLRTAGLTLMLSVALWLVGMVVIRYYYSASGTDGSYFAQSARAFSILMIAIFFLIYRSPFVAACLRSGNYRQYFLICAVSCLPVAGFSLLGRRMVSPEMVPWLACIPDAMAALLFFWRDTRVKRRASRAGRTRFVSALKTPGQ